MDIFIIIYVFILLAGISVGWIFSSYQWVQYKAKQLMEREMMVAELSTIKQQLIHSEHWRNECKLLNHELSKLRRINTSLEADLREVITRLESTQLHLEEKNHQAIKNERYLNEQFESLANRILQQSNKQIDEQNRHSLSELLIPLREQLNNFHRQVQDSVSQESRDRHILSHEIHNLQKLNTKIIQETLNLTRVLKGDNKIQGGWGEMVLARVLEISGLREGYEYETQVNTESDIYDSRMQPDVIVHLPQRKDVIIDAKVTLVAYERYFNAEDDSTRESALKEHIASIRNHIRILSRKDYHQLPSLQSLDYVLMFIAIEPAFLLALNKKPELINEAFKNNIILVSPTTLLVALRTISNLWRYENQSKNAQNIAERASKLYNKIRLFIDDMSSIGQSLEHAQESYNQAMKKLSSGRGNILAQVETFRNLGVNIKREINPKIIKQAAELNAECCVQNEIKVEKNNTDYNIS